MRRSWCLVLVGVAACGGAAPPAEAPSASPEAPAGTVHSGDANTPEGSLAELDNAERQIFAALGGPGGGAQPLGVGGRAVEKKEDQKAPAGEPAPKDATRPNGIQASEQDACTIACSALGSMKRATDRLCGLTGDGDERCTGARGRVASASERVKASCPSCT